MKTQTVNEPKTRMTIMQVLARVIPVLGPVPTMISVYDKAVNALGWNIVAAGSAALLIELLGYFSVNLAERMWSYNKGLRMDEKSQKLSAPTWKAMTAAGLYLIVVEAMIVLVDISIGAAHWLPVTLPFAGIIGSWVVGMSIEQDGRERTVHGYRAKKENDRAQAKAHSDAVAAHGADGTSAVRGQSMRSARAGAPSADAVRAECVALSAQYACTDAQCGWIPSVDALVAAHGAGKSAKSAAASAKAGHVKNKHPRMIAIDKSLLINQDGTQ